MRFIFFIAIFIGFFGFVPTAIAVQFECARDNDTRFIKLDLPGETHLCEVSVTESSGIRDIKWYANHDSNFCSIKVRELKNKYVELWGFSCKSWPDTDGIDKLTNRHRAILDQELKQLISQGKTAADPFDVKSVKALARISEKISSTLVLQFFLQDKKNVQPQDKTLIISDDGIEWQTMASIDVLASHIEPNNGYKIDTAIIAAITDVGALEVITALEKTSTENNARTASCYGSQILLPDSIGSLIPRSPHRFVCNNSNEQKQ